VKKEKNIFAIICLIILLNHAPHISAANTDINQFYYAVEKSNHKKALDMLKNNGDLVNENDQFDFDSPLDNALNNFNKSSIESIKKNPDQTQLLERLFYHNLYQNKLNPLKGASLEDIKNCIKITIKDKKKKRIAIDLLSWAQDLVSAQSITPEEITNELFFESVSEASPKVLRLLQVNPLWLEEKSDNKLNVLQVVMKNYSGRTEEDELITLIITLKPELIFPKNNNKDTIKKIINKHNNYIGRLSKIIYNAIKKIKNFPPEDEKSPKETKEFYLKNYGGGTKNSSSRKSL
jgi:hypothetical protein